MSTRNINRKTYLGTAPATELRPYDQYIRKSGGGNSPRVNGKRIYTENGYTSYIEIIRNPPVQMSGSPSGPWTNGAFFTLGARPEPDTLIEYPTAYDVLPKVYENWRQSEFDIGVSAGEGKETIRMMTDRILSLGRAARELRRGNLQSALRNMTGQAVSGGARARAQKAINLGDIPSAWFETQLGWKPTLADIYNLSDHVQQLPSGSTRIRGSLVKTCGVRAASYSDPGIVANGTCKYGTLVIVEVSRPPTEVERFGLRNPAGVLWNLTNSSWLVDYFVPIGDWFNNISAMGQLPIQKVIVTNFLKFEGYTRLSGNYQGGLYTKLVNSPTNRGVQRTYYVDRQIGGSIHDVVSNLAWAPTIQVPKLDLTMGQLLNAAAWTTQHLYGVMGRTTVDSRAERTFRRVGRAWRDRSYTE